MNQLHLIAIILFSLILGANAWSYKKEKNWDKQYPECKEKHQSPIIINQYSNNPNISKILNLKDFNKLPTKITINNNGHTVEMKADWSGEPPSITGGPLHGNYVFEKTTFRWGQKKAAEHIDFNPVTKGHYEEDMEMHMYFYKTDLKSFEKAQSQKGGLAAISVWLKVDYLLSDYWFENLEKSLNKVQSINSTSEISPFRLTRFPDDLEPIFLFYEGSLDYPPCSESVTWFIFPGYFSVNDNLVSEFRKIKLTEGDVSNIRPPQALNKRQVTWVYTSREQAAWVQKNSVDQGKHVKHSHQAHEE